MGGAIAGGLIARRPISRATFVALAVAGAVADLDLLAGVHSGPTHGFGFAAIAGAIGWIVWSTPPLARASGARLGVAVAAAYASHTLLDWLSTDTSAPFGIMALWPFSSEYYISSLQIFLPVSRRYWLAEAWLLNLRAVIRELLLLGPLLWMVWWIRAEHR
jgi:inner membrane protein